MLQDPVPLPRLYSPVLVVRGCNLSRWQGACGMEHASLDVSENTATDPDNSGLFLPCLLLGHGQVAVVIKG